MLNHQEFTFSNAATFNMAVSLAMKKNGSFPSNGFKINNNYFKFVFSIPSETSVIFDKVCTALTF